MLMCCLFCVHSLARTVPINYILLTTFTFCEAYLVAYVCSAVNDPKVVMAAVFMTAGIVFALTLYSMFTKHDFTVCGGMMFILTIGLMVFGFVCYWLGGATMRLIYLFMGVCLFGLYLIIDT